MILELPHALIVGAAVLQSAVAGYSSQGNLFAGTGYWALQTSLPTQLTDHIVSLDPRQYPLLQQCCTCTCCQPLT